MVKLLNAVMKLFIFLTLVALATAKVINKNDCEGIVVDGIIYAKEVLKEYVTRPFQLTMDYANNVLYFSYFKDNREFAIGYVNLKTNDSGVIEDVTGGFASAVDEKTHSVYFGGSDGIYKKNDQNYAATNLHVISKDIWQMFNKNGLYFSTYPDETAYVYKDGQVKKVDEISNTRALLIAVDNRNNFVFTNTSGLFYYNKEKANTAHIGDHKPNGFTSDVNGKIFFSTPVGIYSMNDKTNEVESLATIYNIYGLAIESDGSYIYSTENSIIRLKSTGNPCA